jgi:hypothetical protein
MLRLVRRPLIPGEFDAERWLPPLFLAGLAAAWAYLAWFGSTPGCLFRRLTDVPCLACGGTRCLRALTEGELVAALAYNPAIFLGLCVAIPWSLWSLAALLRGDPLRLRLVTDDRGERRLRWGLAIALVLHWMWLAWTLPR